MSENWVTDPKFDYCSSLSDGLATHDFNVVAVTFGWAGSFLLLAWCEAALMIESHKLRLF